MKKKDMIIVEIFIGLAILICGVLLMKSEGNEIYSTTYFFELGSRRVKIYNNGNVYDDLEIEEPNHRANYKFLKRLSKVQVDNLKNKIKNTLNNVELEEYVIQLVYGVKEFDNSGNY